MVNILSGLFSRTNARNETARLLEIIGNVRWVVLDSRIEVSKKDNIKIEYCNKNNINLFIIRYDENLIEKLKECLNKYNYFDNF
mgnify:CR=1 FL=1